jgi:hypothetical protein
MIKKIFILFFKTIKSLSWSQPFTSYTLVILAYLGLAKPLNEQNRSLPFLHSIEQLQYIIPESPITIVLEDSFTTGFFIKTYYHRYRIIRTFRYHEHLTAKVSKDLWKSYRDFIGLAIYNRLEILDPPNLAPVPPGIHFINQPAYGYWKIHATEEKTEKVWEFHRSYSHFPQIFGWQKFRPNEEFYKKYLQYITNINQRNDKIPFRGLQNEFSQEGALVRKFISQPSLYRQKKKIKFSQWLKDHLGFHDLLSTNS